MHTLLKRRSQLIDWPAVAMAASFLVTLGCLSWSLYGVSHHACRSDTMLLSEELLCPSMGEDIGALIVAVGFTVLATIPWWLGNQHLPAFYFLNIACILAIGALTLDDGTASRIFNVLLAFFAPLTLVFHLRLFQLSMQRYRPLIAIGYTIALLFALPFIIWPSEVQEELGYRTFFRWNTRFGLLAAFLVVTIIAIFEYRKRGRLAVRSKIRLITFGTIIAFAPMLLLSVLPELLSGPNYVVPYALTFPGLLFSPLTYIYSLFRHRLLAFERLINRALIYYMLVVLLGGIYLIGINIINATTSTLLTLSTTNLILNIILLLSLPLLHNGLQRLSDWVLSGGEINYRQIEEALSQSFSLVLDRETLKQLLLNELPSRLQIEGAMLFLRGETDDLACVGAAGFAMPEECNESTLTHRPLITYLETVAKPIPGETILGLFTEAISGATEQFLFTNATLSYWIPLISGRKLQGIYLLSTRRDSDYLTANDEHLLVLLTHSAGSAAYNTRLLQQAAKHQQDLTKVHQQILIHREQDQQRIAHELHDNAIQQLIGIGYELAELRRLANQGQTLSGDQIDHVRTSLLEVSSELRQVVGKLHPAGLADLGITNALQGYLARLKQTEARNLPVIEARLDEDTLWLPMPVAICLYRVAQESIQNAIRHAQATNITMELRIETCRVLLTIKDNGCGFLVPTPLSKLAQNDHYGLVGMAERVQWVNGQMAIDSAPGIGTMIHVALPIDRDQLRHDNTQ